MKQPGSRSSRPLSRREMGLREQLEELYRRFHHPKYLPNDPLSFAHRFDEPEDQEIAALLAAGFASGNIKAILAFLDQLFRVLRPHPAAWLREHSAEEIHGRFEGIYHRWVWQQDIEVIAVQLGETLRRFGSLGDLWREVDDPEEETTQPALARFVETIRAQETGPLRPRVREQRRANGRIVPLPPASSIVLTSPAGGSACKRMNLFLRWLARPADGIDLGLWTEFLAPARLVMPIDVHVLRFARKLGLTRRPNADRKSAEEITSALRRIQPEDPCRYDFSLVRAATEES